ncbi:MAG: hypothetical protein JJ895_00500 [Balneolaceae bacterium]|nr:hypothetical protein [Balneolaceae bacterium]
MRKYIITVLVFLASISTEAQEVNQSHNIVIGISNDVIKLEKNLSYYYFNSTNKYLGWYEGYTNTLTVINLESRDVIDIPVNKGRGPFEFSLIRGFTIIDDKAYILDLQNLKIVKFDLDQNVYLSEKLLGRNRITHLTTNGEILLGRGLSRNAIYFEIDKNDLEISAINNSINETIADDFLKNPYKSDGPFIANKEYILSLRRYESSMYFYKESVLVDEYFDDMITNTDYKVDGFGFAQLPEETSYKLLDAALDNKNNLLILAKGATKNFKYGNHIVSVLNLNSEKFARSIELNELQSPRRLVLNDDNLFVYDEEKYVIKIFNYE